jgi:predicted dehydrogenase
VELVAVAETDPGIHGSCRAAVPHAAVFADYSELLDRAAIDAAVICLPTALHAEAAVACFEHGLHVYVEKPLASTLDEGERVLAAWRRAGTIGALGYNFRFHPLVLRLRDALRNRELGEITGAQTVFCAARRALPEWKRRRSSGGGVLLDLVSHHVDLMRFLFDTEVVEVHAILRGVESEDDTAALTLRLGSGPVVTILASLAAVEEDRIAIYGDRGGLLFDRYRSSRLIAMPPVRDSSAAPRARLGLRAFAGAIREVVRPAPQSSFETALAAFAGAAVGRGRWTGADLEDGQRSLAVLIAAERTARDDMTHGGIATGGSISRLEAR